MDPAFAHGHAIGAAVACLVLVGWAWSLAASSILGFVLIFLLGLTALVWMTKRAVYAGKDH